MGIRTTLNIRIELLEKLKVVKDAYNVPFNRLVSMLLEKAKEWKDNKNAIKTFKTHKYQDRAPKDKWHKLHLTLKEDLYEQCFDMRRLYRRSISLILAICINKYLEIMKIELEKEAKSDDKDKNTDNYSEGYLLSCKEISGIFTYSVFWGIPDAKTLKDLVT